MLVRPDTEAPISLYDRVDGRPDGRDHVIYQALLRHRLAAKRSASDWEPPTNEETIDVADQTASSNSTAFQL